MCPKVGERNFPSRALRALWCPTWDSKFLSGPRAVVSQQDEQGGPLRFLLARLSSRSLARLLFVLSVVLLLFSLVLSLPLLRSCR